MDGAADVVAQVGVVLAAVSGFTLLLALLARPWLGRRATDEPARELVSTNPYEAALAFMWRQRRWAGPVFIVGCALAVLGAIAGT